MRKSALITALILAATGTGLAQNQAGSTQPYRVPWATPQVFPEQDTPPPTSPFFPPKTTPQSSPTPLPGGPYRNSRFQKIGPDATYKRGSAGPEVLELQKTLIDLGFGLPAGADGQYGGQTEDAVKAFQSSQNLTKSGKLDKATLEALDRVAPAPGKKVWEDSKAAAALPPAPLVGDKKCRALIDLSEFRVSVYKEDGALERVFPLACGASKTPTHAGAKIVVERLADPSGLAWKLWPESKGKAFGDRLLDLSWYDPATGSSAGSDEELHGTYDRESIGSQSSHGCIRLYNENIEWMYQNLKVGDLVIVRP